MKGKMEYHQLRTNRVYLKAFTCNLKATDISSLSLTKLYFFCISRKMLYLSFANKLYLARKCCVQNIVSWCILALCVHLGYL